MLITFHTPSYADITLFGEVGKKLIELMGHTPTVPGAILAEDLPAALTSLRAGIATASAQEQSAPPNDSPQDDAPRPVSLAHRALPVIQLLESALAGKQNVMWD